jgi:nitrite reductase/ring-hydroxylating ferredoxin subunit
MNKEYLGVICPHCGGRMNLPYIYDGSYEVRCDYHNCLFYVLIRGGSLHVWGSKEDLEKFSRLSDK